MLSEVIHAAANQHQGNSILQQAAGIKCAVHKEHGEHDGDNCQHYSQRREAAQNMHGGLFSWYLFHRSFGGRGQPLSC